MIEFFKLIFSRDFISNVKDIISLLRKSKEWKKDIVKLSGSFSYKDKIESTVLIDQSIKVLIMKGWSDEERNEIEFILSELFENSFNHSSPSKEFSSVDAEITITSTFFKLAISDFGVQFDLLQELKNQEALNPDSEKHRGLSFINKLTPEIYQEKRSSKNTIIVIKREGLKPLKVTKNGDVVIFKVGNSIYINDCNFSAFINRIKSLMKNEKVVIDFRGPRNMMSSMAYREIRKELIGAKMRSNLKISVCGLAGAPFAIREYFSKHFPEFNTLEEAVAYHNNKK